jgi:hypothetical protein
MTKKTQTPAHSGLAYIVWFVPEREGAPWTRIGALWPTRPRPNSDTGGEFLVRLCSPLQGGKPGATGRSDGDPLQPFPYPYQINGDG